MEKMKQHESAGRPKGSNESREVTGTFICRWCGYKKSYKGAKKDVTAMLIDCSKIHYRTCQKNPMRPR